MNELEALPQVERRIERVGGELHNCFGPLAAKNKRKVWQHCSHAVDVLARVWPAQAIADTWKGGLTRVKWFQMPP